MLKENQVQNYWEERVGKHGARAIGLGNRSLDFQSKLHKQRIDFIFPRCPQSLRTLDFGCGTGNFSSCFESYLGVDINNDLLSLAKERHPKKDFSLLKQSFLSEEMISFANPELFFSATVLQHNSDDLVRKIFRSMMQINRNITFSIYENSHAIEKKHIIGRTSEEYVGFLSEYFDVSTSQSFSHYIHRERHTLTLVEVTPLLEMEK